MCLVEFGSLTDSLYAMGKLQGIEVGGKKMRLSFTRSRPKKNQNSPNHKFNDPFSWVLPDMAVRRLYFTSINNINGCINSNSTLLKNTVDLSSNLNQNMLLSLTS